MKQQSINIVKAITLLLCCLLSGSIIVMLIVYMLRYFCDDNVLTVILAIIFPAGPVFIACVLGTSNFLKANKLTKRIPDILKIFVGALEILICAIVIFAILFFIITTLSVSSVIIGSIFLFFVASLLYAHIQGLMEAIREF